MWWASEPWPQSRPWPAADVENTIEGRGLMMTEPEEAIASLLLYSAVTVLVGAAVVASAMVGVAKLFGGGR